MWGGRIMRWLGGTAMVVLVPVGAVVTPTATARVAGAPAGVAAAAPGPSFHPVVPARVMDTRSGTGTTAAPLGAGETRALQVVAQADVPADAVAVALNVTVTEPTAATYVTVWPDGAPRPTASNVNVIAGQTVANMVTVGLGPDGQVDLFNFNGAAEVVVDVTGWYADGFKPVVPVRVADTRSGLGGRTFQAGESRDIDLSAAGVPAGATAVVANLTAVNASAATYVTAWPSGAAMPTASNLNVVPAQTVP